MRGPLCINPAAARTVLPSHLERTQWVLAGLTRDEMLARAGTSTAANAEPAPGAMCYMLSKGSYLSDAGGHWHPHHDVLWVYRADAAAWGANLHRLTGGGRPRRSWRPDVDLLRAWSTANGPPAARR